MKYCSIHRCRRPRSRPNPAEFVPGESRPAMSRGERWLFGLLFVAAAVALAQQLSNTLHFATRVPEIAEMVRHWFANAV